MPAKANKYHVVNRIVFRTSVFLCFLVAVTSRLAAQEVDSLRAVLKAHQQNDTTKVNLLVAVADKYRDINLDSEMIFARQGLELAGRLNFEKGKARSMRCLGIAYLRRNEFDASLKYYGDAAAIYQKTGDKQAEARILLSVSDIYYRQGKFDTSIATYNKSISLSHEVRDLKTEGLALLDIGGIYMDQGNFTEAIRNYLQGLTCFEKLKDNEDIAMTLVNVATVYATMGDYKMASDYVNRSLKITDIKNREVQFSNYVNTGFVYAQMKDYRNALVVFNRGMELGKALGDERWMSLCISNIADAYFRLRKYDSSYTLYNELLARSIKAEDSLAILQANESIGSILIKKGRAKEGVAKLRSVLQIAQEKQMNGNIFDIAMSLSEGYEQLHDYKNALDFQKLGYNYHDTLYNEKSDKRVAQMQYSYDLEKKESQISLLNKDKEIQKTKSEHQQTMLWAMIGGIVLLSVFSTLLYRERQLEKQNKIRLMKQHEEIQVQAKRLEELNRFKDKTFSVLSHDLRGPLGSVTSTVQMLDQDLLSDEEYAEMKPEVNRQLKAVNILLDNLLQWARNYIHGETHANPAMISLQQSAIDTIALLKDGADAKQIHINNNIPASLMVWCDPEQLQIIVRNIIMNAIKFTPHGGAIDLSAISNDSRVQLSISDTGVGMSAEQVDKLFTSDPENSTYGTDGEKGIGLGMLLCYEFVRANNGSISVSSAQGRGTTFNLQFPSGA